MSGGNPDYSQFPIAQLKHLQDLIEGFDVDFRRDLMEAEPSLVL